MTTTPKEPEDDAAETLLQVLNTLGYDGLPAAERRDHIIARLMRADWAGAGVIEFDDYLLFPDKLIRRRADGTWEEKGVMLRVPRENDLRKARVLARSLAASEKIDEATDRDMFVNLENLCVLAYAIRNNTPPFEPWQPEPLLLERQHDKVCLQGLWNKLDQLNEVLNPAPNQLSSGEIVALIAAIARSRNLGPLVVYGPGAQSSFVVSMADLLLNLVGSKLSSESIERLIAASLRSSASAP